MVSTLALVLFLLCYYGIAYLVIRALRRAFDRDTRSPRARDLVPAHIQQQRKYRAVIKRQERRMARLWWKFCFLKGQERAPELLREKEIMQQIMWHRFVKPRWAGAILLLFAVLLSGCYTDPVSKSSTNNPNVPVELLLTKDGCNIYRFFDGGYAHYFASCSHSVSVSTAFTEQEGKTTHTRYDVTPTVVSR